MQLQNKQLAVPLNLWLLPVKKINTLLYQLYRPIYDFMVTLGPLETLSLGTKTFMLTIEDWIVALPSSLKTPAIRLSYSKAYSLLFNESMSFAYVTPSLFYSSRQH